ncbi:MAG: hypothetical protein ACI4RN_07030 [Oscillospiraceae bacterium]
MKRKKKIFSLFLSGMLIINLLSFVSVEVWGTVVEDLQQSQSEIISKAEKYLADNVNQNGSFGNNTDVINETAEAVSVLKHYEDFNNEKSIKWLKDNGSNENIDTMARTAIASGDAELLESILPLANKDGGFGMHKDYTSDILDSVLVLEAINTCGSSLYKDEGSKLCTYLAGKANDDGSWSYSSDSESDIILTAMVSYNISKFLSDNSLASKDITTILNNSMKYLNSSADVDFSKNEVEKTLYIQLAAMQHEGKIDYKTVVESLQDIQQDNGSFYDSVHITSLVLKLLDGMNFENSLRINAMNTALNTNSGFIGQDINIVSQYAISYSTVIDDKYTLKTTVTNGKEVIYTNEIPVELLAEKTILSGTAAEFTLNQMRDDGIVVKTELCSSEGVIETTTKNITLQEVPVTGSTELTDFSLELSDYYTYTGFPIDVAADYKLLYATNVENSVDMQFTVTKDGEEIASDSQTAKLIPSENTFKETGIKFTPDTEAAGTYTVTAKCLYNGEVAAERSADFQVVELQQLEQPDEGENPDEGEDEPAPSIVVTWAGPVLSDYYVYSGLDNEINVNAQIMYYSSKDFTGNISMKVTEGDTVITENQQKVTLEKGEPTYFDGKAEFPVFKTENFLTFIAKNKGKIAVYMEFTDLDGNVLASDTKYVTIVDKPVQDLILNSNISTEKKQTVDLSWNDISNDAENYSYKLYRRIKGEDWETRSIWNEHEKVKVLNVYPSQPYLETWMTTTISNTESPAGMGLFDIDSVHISAFNSNPASYLYNKDGSWKFDVLFFGSSDCNSGYDLSSASVQYLQEFIDNGRGVLFGHDTICGYLGHPNFNKFAEQTGILVSSYGSVHRTTSVSVVNIGTLTNFPWAIRGNLTVPNTHSSGQFLLNGTEWLTLNTVKDTEPTTGATNSFYLATKGNLGMIQTGDSNGQATDDERKILANTLFYLYQKTKQTTAKDNSFYDVAAPDKAEADIGTPDNGKVSLSLKSKDNATDYDYYISAEPDSDTGSSVVNSNVVSESALAGLNGFVVEVNDKSDPCPELITYDETNEFVQNVQTADSSGKLTTSVNIPDFGKQYYIHVFAVDNANNVSEETIIPIGEASAETEITTDKDIYNPGDTVKISTLTSSVLFDITADVNLSIYDENGNLTKELASSASNPLSPDEKYPLDSEWTIPELFVGDYTAKIEWTSGERKLASAAHDFIVSANGEVNNTVNTDKETYYSSEPVNILNTVMNSSTNADVKNLALNVSVYNENSKKVAEFNYDTGALQPKSDYSYSDVIKPGRLNGGVYKVLAELSDTSGVASQDTAQFKVVDTSVVIVGDIKITPNGDYTQKVDFNVTNKSSSDIENAVIKVNIYPADDETLVGTIIKQTGIKSGETLEFSELLDTKSYNTGTFIGVLTAETENDMTELDRDSFNIEKKYIEPDSSVSDSVESQAESSSNAPQENSSESEVISESKTDSSNPSSDSDTSAVNSDTDSSAVDSSPASSVSSDSSNTTPDGSTVPNTGVKSPVSIILLISAILCAAGLVVIRLMGVKENEKKNN